MMILLDTHIWIWWVTSNLSRLGQRRFDYIAQADEVCVSTISCFEVAWLAQHGRISLSIPISEWFESALQDAGISLLPITPQIAEIAVALPEHHTDPQDRLIIATAIAHQAGIISADAQFHKYDQLDHLLIK